MNKKTFFKSNTMKFFDNSSEINHNMTINQSISKNVIGIRAHQWTPLEENLYLKLSQYFDPQNIFIVVNELNAPVNIPAHIQKISLNKDFLTRNQLLNYTHTGLPVTWLCGDYTHYALLEKVQADYYWSVESDVLFTFDHLSELFSCFENYQEDGLLYDVIKLNDQSWYWYKSTRLIYDVENTYRCFFPLNRLSKSAVELCLKERQRVSKLFADNNAFSSENNPLGVYFPNDESLVVNTLKRENCSVIDLRTEFPHFFEYMTNWNYFLQPTGQAYQLKNQVIHPIKTIDGIVKNIVDTLIPAINKTSYLNHNTVNKDNIHSVALLAGMKIAEHIERQLSEKIQGLENKQKVRDYVRDYIPAEYSNATRMWDFNNIVVVDYKYKEFTFTLDFVVEKDRVKCECWERSNKNKDWATLVKNEFNIQNNVVGKVLILENLINDISLEKNINDTLKCFYKLVNQSY